MNYAIIKSGGKQYKVKEGDVIEIERLKDFTSPVSGEAQKKDSKKSKKIVFDQVLAVFDDEKGSVELGSPLLAGKKVQAEFLEEIKADKIRIMKFKPKKRYLKRQGHRQKYFRVKIINL